MAPFRIAGPLYYVGMANVTSLLVTPRPNARFARSSSGSGPSRPAAESGCGRDHRAGASASAKLPLASGAPSSLGEAPGWSLSG